MSKNGTFCELRLYFFPLYDQKFRKKNSNHLTYTLILRYLPLKPNIFIILIAFYEIFRKHLFLLIFCTTLWKIGILTQNFDFFLKKINSTHKEITIICIFNHENKFNDFRNCADPKALCEVMVRYLNSPLF